MEKTRLPLAQITPGMKLAEPITNASGITLMPAGIRLTPMFISRIKKWNIEAIDIFVEKKSEADARAVPTARGDLPSRVQTDPAAVRGHTKALPISEARSAEEMEFARTIVKEISPAFTNVRDNAIMMQLRAAVIKRLIHEGRKGVVNRLRQLPPEPQAGEAGGGGEDANGA